MTRTQMMAVVFLLGVTLCGWLVWGGMSVSIRDWQPYFLSVTVLGIAIGLFDRYFWRWKAIRLIPGLSTKPVLRGAWKVQIESDFIDPASGKAKIVEGYYLIRQTYLHLTIRLFTSQTSSKTRCAQFVCEDDGEWALFASYIDTPAPSVRDKSVMHHGALSVLVSEVPVVGLQGTYWTDRGTKGSVRSLAYLPNGTFSDFASAKRLFSVTKA